MSEVNFFIHKKILDAYLKNKRYTVVYGGRGSGKSTQEAALTIIYAIQNPGCRILCVRGTQNKISESSLEILKDVIGMMKLDNYFDYTEHTLSCKNGSEFLFYGAKAYLSFKSLQGIDLVFVDEATELSKDAWEVLTPTVREDESRFIISFNPDKETDAVYDMFITNKHPDAEVVKINYYDNPYFPEVLRKEMEYDKKINYAKYLHVWEGELRHDNINALWKKDEIIYDREILYDETDTEFDKIVIALDPSGTANKNSDEAGIIVAGKKNNCGYILQDNSGIYSQSEQAQKAIDAYYNWKADYIVLEKNGVGAGMKTIIQQLDRTVPVHEVVATRGKLLRAEPVKALYEQGVIFHTKIFTELEYEMIMYDGDTKQSPNRLDAMVYAITDLFIKKQAVIQDGLIEVDYGMLAI